MEGIVNTTKQYAADYFHQTLPTISSRLDPLLSNLHTICDHIPIHLLSLPPWTYALLTCAPLPTTALLTALTGTPTILTPFLLTPGLHLLQTASSLSAGEFPACAAMTSGYVFRVENEGTVLQLQRAGRTGELTTILVTTTRRRAWLSISSLCNTAAALLTLLTAATLYILHDYATLFSLSLLLLVNLINSTILHLRALPSWFGAAEPGVHGDLLILLSRDRWIRMKGLVDDLKAVTSGAWLREATFLESALASLCMMLVYINVGVAARVSQEGGALMLMLLFASAVLVGCGNAVVEVGGMKGRGLLVAGRKKYARRLEMARELVEETGREDWAVRLGMVQPKGRAGEEEGEKIM